MPSSGENSRAIYEVRKINISSLYECRCRFVVVRRSYFELSYIKFFWQTLSVLKVKLLLLNWSAPRKTISPLNIVFKISKIGYYAIMSFVFQGLDVWPRFISWHIGLAINIITGKGCFISTTCCVVFYFAILCV